MKRLEFTTDIAADKKKVWNTMLNPETYKQWVDVAWPGSYFEGLWAKGEQIRFISPGQGGTLAELKEQKPYETILAEQVAVINPDGSEDRESKIAKGWIGTTERYTFNEQNGKTNLVVEINTPPSWAEMFEDGWPKALAKLKEMCERN
jgi:uncharacterized protein YndB with AHSA1/START domain